MAISSGRFVPNSGGDGMRFVSSEVLTFSGDAIIRIETYRVILS